MTTVSNLHVTALNPEQHRKTCGYWFVVTSGAMPCTAFATRAGFLQWLSERGLYCPKTVPEAGNWATMPIVGRFREKMHLDTVAEFDAIKPDIDTRDLSNGDYVEAKITIDPDGIRTVHTLNPNVRTRHVFDYAESRKLMN